MIPKTIHYCWFGRNPLPQSVEKYIESWKKFCPDYKIICWNEDNFDVNQNKYCAEAYQAKKWAFVTDYVRLKVLYDYGGIYMDSDVEVVKPLDPLLKYDAFSGFENIHSIPTGTMGAVKNNEWIYLLLKNYDDRHFINSDGSLDFTTNVQVITKLTKEKYNIRLDNTKQIFGNNMIILPFDYLCAKDYRTRQINRTENTYTIHHFAGSWLPNKQIQFMFDMENRWVKLASSISWKQIEKKYPNMFPNVTVPEFINLYQLMIGMLILQDKYKFTDKEMINQLAENRYFQYFCGFDL